MTHRPQAVIVHGTYGRPSGNWFGWLKNELVSRGYEVTSPRFPTPEGQSLDSWLAVWRDEVDGAKLDERTLLFGHSLGVAFVLSVLELEIPQPVAGAFLVAGFTGKLGLPDFDPINESFVCRQFDWARIKKNAHAFYVVSSDNDQYVPLERGQLIAAELGVPLAVVPGGGHLNAASGHTTFPLLLSAVNTVLTGVING
jgi:predicted alpha/beta hydrolase family esterase